MCEKLPCVCDICNCGKHKCPNKLRCPGHWDKCILSEYNTRFVPHDICPSKSFKPAFTMLLGDGPLSQETTHRADFIPRCTEAPKKFLPPEYVKPEGLIDDLSMYRKEFGPKELCARVNSKVAPTRRVLAKFDGETTNRNDYRTWDLPCKIVRKPDTFQPSTDKFDGIPSYQRDFIPHSLAPTESFKPKVTFLQSTEPMAKDTDYRETYVNHPLPRRAEKIKPCYFQTRVPLDSLTTHRKEYTPKEICPQKNYKPKAHFIQTDKPLSDETTHRTDFRMHDVEKPFRYEPEKYVKSLGDMDLETTYNKDFTNIEACRVISSKPLITKRVSAPFSGETSYRENFKKWDVLPVRVVRTDCFQPSTDPFDDCTTFKSAFVPHEICMVKSFKPEPLIASSQPFDDATSYRTEYTKKSQPCCPAAFLTTNSRAVSPDGYIYHCEDQKGHLHYRRESLMTKEAINPNTNYNNSQALPTTEVPHPLVVVPLEA